MTEHITEEQLKELEEAQKKTTLCNIFPGFMMGFGHTQIMALCSCPLAQEPDIDNVSAYPTTDENFKYIELLFSLDSALIAEVRRLREENKQLGYTAWKCGQALNVANNNTKRAHDRIDELEKELQRLRDENKRLDDELMAWELQFPTKRKRLTPEKIDELVEIIRKE